MRRLFERVKPAFLVFSAALLAYGTARAGSKAVGERNASGVPVGDYKIVGEAGNTQAEGKFKDGKMDGTWRFYNSHHTEIAEVVYLNGVPAGKYRTFFGASVNPAAAGKLESEGEIRDGMVVGTHLAYGPAGKVFSEATFEKGKVQQTKTGTNEMAAGTAEEDLKLVRTIEGIVRDAVK